MATLEYIDLLFPKNNGLSKIIPALRSLDLLAITDVQKTQEEQRVLFFIFVAD